MKIEKIKLSQIKPYEHNAKLHPSEQIEQIKNSIRQFGDLDPIAIDENGVIIEGHGRYKALQELGYTEAEVIRLNNLTEEQKRAYILVHNQLTLNTGFDKDKLREQIEQIKDIDLSEFDLDLADEIEEMPEPDTTEPEDEDTHPDRELQSFVLTLPEDSYQELMQLVDLQQMDEVKVHDFGNPNKRNNNIFEVVYQWAKQKKLL